MKMLISFLILIFSLSTTLTFNLKNQSNNLGLILPEDNEDISQLRSNIKFDINQLKSDGEYQVIKDQRYPNQAIRYKTPKLCDKVIQYSGYLDTSNDDHFFFWFFESRYQPDKAPLILWLNGGPGCSSMLGLLMEIGPCRVNKGGKDTINNPYAWNNIANVLYLDQPINTGFSYGSSTVNTTTAASKDVYAFLQLFFEKFPKYRSLEFHILGESYAGHYIPHFAKLIHTKNQSNGLNKLINLKSIGIGNGLTDAYYQFPSNVEMACNSNYGSVLNPTQCKLMQNSIPKCQQLIQECYNNINPTNCKNARNYCSTNLEQPYFNTGQNPYDIRRKCGTSDLCYSIIEDISIYLNQKNIQLELGAKVKYQTCSSSVNSNFSKMGDLMYPYVRDVPILLEGGIKVLIFAGDADFICNWIGNKAWTIELPWSGHSEFSKAKDRLWINSKTNTTAGEVRSFDKLTFVRIFNAGHMAPYDQPEHSLDLITKWLQNKEF